ncbi:MAG: indole-3-glycerol phosphate synthase TrpC [Actinobacteria bacterium]|nr:indole-3-glycerol phosphate synthase TrpC [Actinomycetota bacterium]
MFLDQVAALTRERVERAMREFPPYLLREACRKTADPPSFAAALRGQRGDGVGVIAEIKRSSPSRGPIRPELVVEELVVAYERGGACALSVLTEPAFFSGSMEDLRQAARATRLPVMRKDFILHPYQLLEARAAGASAVLLLVALLGEGGLAFMLGEARRAGLEALVEVHDEEEVEIALRAGADVLGINNRDLRTLHVDLDTTRRLARIVPGEMVLVSESGYSRAEDLAGLKALGVDAVLVGGHLSGSDDPEAALRELVRHARPEQAAGACRARESGKG